MHHMMPPVLLGLNVNHLVDKIDDIVDLITLHDLDIVFLAETFPLYESTLTSGSRTWTKLPKPSPTPD